MPGIKQLLSFWWRLWWIWRVALQPKVHIINTVGLLPVYLSWGDIPSGNVACGETFLINTACWITYGHAVWPTLDSTLFSIVMVMVTRVLLTLSAMPFSCGVLGFVFSWTIPIIFRYAENSDEKYLPL